MIFVCFGGLRIADKGIPKQSCNEVNETKKKEELEKRRKREEILSEKELNDLREQSKTLKAQVKFFSYDLLI